MITLLAWITVLPESTEESYAPINIKAIDI
jgi:hypothetical protein